MTKNPRTEQLLAKILPTVGLAWATRAPKPVTVGKAPGEIVVEPTADGWVIDAADALALAWASRG